MYLLLHPPSIPLSLLPSSMGTFVTLAEVLEARGSPLDEGELWGLLLATAESLLEISCKGIRPLRVWFP